jgi:hypothetical protein
MFLRPHHGPRAIFASKLPLERIGSIVALKPVRQMICVADVEAARRVFKDVGPEHTELAPEVGLEPTTRRLTADCSTIELLPKNAKPPQKRRVGNFSRTGGAVKADPHRWGRRRPILSVIRTGKSSVRWIGRVKFSPTGGDVRSAGRCGPRGGGRCRAGSRS